MSYFISAATGKTCIFWNPQLSNDAFVVIIVELLSSRSSGKCTDFVQKCNLPQVQGVGNTWNINWQSLKRALIWPWWRWMNPMSITSLKKKKKKSALCASSKSHHTHLHFYKCRPTSDHNFSISLKTNQISGTSRVIKVMKGEIYTRHLVNVKFGHKRCSYCRKYNLYKHVMGKKKQERRQ